MAACLAVALGFAWSSAARAQDVELKREIGKTKAKAVFKMGMKLFEQKKYREAIVAFKEAYRLHNHYVIQFNLALSYAMLKDRVSAVRHLLRFLQFATGSEREIPDVLNRMRQQVGLLTIRNVAAGLKAYVNGSPVEGALDELVFEPGSVTVEIRRGGSAVKTATLALEAGKETVWDASAGPPSAATPPSAPVASASPVAAVVAPASQPSQGPAEGRRSRRLHWGFFAGAAALTVSAFVCAIALSALTKQSHDDFDATPTSSLRDQGQSYQLGANVSWGLTGAFAVGTAVLAFFTRWKSDEPRVSLFGGPSKTGFAVGLELHHF